MIKLGQIASTKKNGRMLKGVVTFVSDNGLIAAFTPEGNRFETMFHVNHLDGKLYTSTGNPVILK